LAGRLLHADEIAMARLVFGAAIDYARVRIHNRCYLPFGLQPRNCAMAPNGSIYFHPSCYLDNYATADPPARHWFIHEMTHVWQHQLGYPVRLRGAIRIGLRYTYRLRAGATLADFNMEAQGDVLADYFALKFLRLPAAMRQAQYVGELASYETVLALFLAQPASRRNLPCCIKLAILNRMR
jgi:hypothetical protein